MSRHSEQCFAIGGGPGHDACICVCHGTMSAKAAMLDDPDWHAAACAYDAGPNDCDCLLPDRLAAIEREALGPPTDEWLIENGVIPAAASPGARHDVPGVPEPWVHLTDPDAGPCPKCGHSASGITVGGEARPHTCCDHPDCMTAAR